MWWWYRDREDYGQFVADGTGQTDKQGHLNIAARDGAQREPDDNGPIDYILSTSVTDATDQTLGKSTIVTAHQTQFYLGMHANEYVQAVGMPFGVNLVALDPGGKQVAAKVHRLFIRMQFSCEWQTVGMRSFQHCDQSEHKIIERDVDLAAGGSHTERIYPDTRPGRLHRARRVQGRGRQQGRLRERDRVIGKGGGVLERRRGRPHDRDCEQAELQGRRRGAAGRSDQPPDG